MNSFSSAPDESMAEASVIEVNSRRAFLQQVAAAGTLAAGAVVAGACAPAVAATSAAQAATPPTASGGWDMSWRGHLGKYRTAYDSPEVMFGAALAYASAAAAGYKQAMHTKDGEFTPVLILRHAASIMVLNDAMWNKMAFGESGKLKDPTTGEPTLRNPFINYKSGDKFSMIGAEGGLDVLMSQGAVVLTCGIALRGLASQLRRKETQLTVDESMKAVRAAVLPGVYVMPNGVFAVSAAQDAGCHYMRVLV